MHRRSPSRVRARTLVTLVAGAWAFALAPEGAARADEPLPEAPPTPAPPPPPTPPSSPPPGGLVVAPRATQPLDVPYPEGAHGDAEVVLVLVVAADGTVASAVAESGLPPFTDAAEHAARGFVFVPASRGGVNVAAKIKVAIGFREPEPEPEPVGAAGAAVETQAPSGAASGARPPRRVLAPPEDAPAVVEVRGAREPSRTASLGRAEVRQIPGTFGDPFRAVEIMPGVTPIVSGLPFFFIRGAPPGNAGYFLDGVRVPLLFHVGAGPSVIHPGLVDRVDLYPGGYPARFGRFAGGIVSGETTAPKPEARGEANVRLFDAGALVEAPFAKGKGNVLLGGRYSYTALLLTQLSDTLLDYWDYQARVSYDVGPDDRLGVFAFGSYDYLGQKTPTETLTVFGTEFHRVDLRWDHRLGARGRVRVAATVGADRSRLQEQRFVRDTVLGARMELTERVSDAVLVRAGTDVQSDRYSIGLEGDALSPSVQQAATLFPARTDLAVGARADAVLTLSPRFEVTPGVRLDLFTSQGQAAVGVDPRVALRTQLVPRVALLGAFGLAHQPPSFAVPVPGFQPGGLRGGLQRALQESAGLEVDLGQSTVATATVFHNGFFQMSDPLGTTVRDPLGCAPGTFPTGSLAGDRGSQPGAPGGGGGGGGTCGVPRFVPGTVGPDRSGGGGQGADSNFGRDAATALEVRTRGAAYGLELFLKRKLTSRVGGFLSYTLSRSTRTYGTQVFTASFDRTHVANAALAFDLGRNWRAGTRGVFYTGLPKPPDPGETEGGRLPVFFRLDLRLEKRWQLGRTTWLSVVGEWMNATLSKEAVSTRCTLQGCESETIGPVTIPSLGLEGGF